MDEETRVAWVTGGGRGIGRATALALAEAGHAVGVSARTEEELEATARACRDHGVKAAVAPCDVTEPGAVERAYERVQDALGPPGILVNNAGLARGIPFAKTTAEDMRQAFEVNLMGAFHATQVALPAMVEASWGRIVNVASVAGKVGSPYTTAYSVSKHGLVGMTRCLSQELATKGITVNAVCPGYVDTPMTDRNVAEIAQRTGMPEEKAREHLEGYSPQGRMMTPEEIAAHVAHLCTEASYGINGQAITVDGGGVQW